VPVNITVCNYYADAVGVVVTLDYLTNAVQNPAEWLPSIVLDRVANSTLLFIGFALHHWKFRILLRSLRQQLKGNPDPHIAIQVAPVNGELSGEQSRRVYKFLQRYFTKHNTNVYLMKSGEFVEELQRRWNEANS